jgi:hypothetical protein
MKALSLSINEIWPIWYFCRQQTNADRRTSQKLYAPDLLIREHKDKKKMREIKRKSKNKHLSWVHCREQGITKSPTGSTTDSVKSTSSALTDWSLQFYVPLENLSLIMRKVTITGEELQNWDLCLALRASEQRGISIVPYSSCDTGPRFYSLIRRTVPFSRLLRHPKGRWGPILIQILTGSHSVAS